ncbi:MAG: AbrB/MazE/SpoVT family DNA-binding domain-containing protein [Clostridia bacterium]|nr:AbrB/MazE/SpoVT family DNA-binding domain-containing protein [Clostridia bacterium]
MKMTTTIQKWGNSQGIRIPKILLDTVEWGENEQIIILVDNGKLVIEKANNRKNIKELFEDFEGKYEPIEMDWGEPVGEEIW